MKPAKKSDEAIEVLKVSRETLTMYVLSDTPMIMNRMSNKTLTTLLAPKGKKTTVEKQSSLKHDVYEEYRSSPYLSRDDKSPTYIEQLATCFKKAIQGAALDSPGANKSQIGRLCWVVGERIAIYGVPKLFMAVTRSADMNKTPDVRTRVILPEWACKLTFEYVTPMLNRTTVANLFAMAGMTQGIGDWRVQKGSGTYGQFHLVDADDKDFLRIIKAGGRAAQMAGMQTPEPYDSETEELLSWYDVETKRRGFEVVKNEGKAA